MRKKHAFVFQINEDGAKNLTIATRIFLYLFIQIYLLKYEQIYSWQGDQGS